MFLYVESVSLDLSTGNVEEEGGWLVELEMFNKD